MKQQPGRCGAFVRCLVRVGIVALICASVFVPVVALGAPAPLISVTQTGKLPGDGETPLSSEIRPTAVRRQYASACLMGISIWPASDLPRQSGAADGLGACWTRVAMHWDKIEPLRTEPRTYDWSVLDAAIQSASAAGLKMIVTLLANPAWAAEYPGGPTYNVQELLGFLTAAAERYDADGYMDAPGSPYVQIWELYNEPDNQTVSHALKRGWGYWGGRGGEYVQFLAQSRVALRAANPRAEVALGGLAHERVNVFDMDFPHQVFAYIRDNPGEYFDYFNVHYFPVFESVYIDWGRGIAGKINYFREMMGAYGVSWPIIVTESGYWSGSEQPDPWVGTHEQQSEYVIKLYARSYALNLKMVSWLLLYDLPVHDADRGLSDVNGVAKPAYYVYRNFVNKIRSTYYERALSAGELGSADAEGYVFVDVASGRRIYVVWSNTQASGRLHINYPAILVSDKVSGSDAMTPAIDYFNAYKVLDDDGDGGVSVDFGPSPIYIEELRKPPRNSLVKNIGKSK